MISYEKYSKLNYINTKISKNSNLQLFILLALPQIRVETLIGSQANYEINIKRTIYFYKKMISYEKYSTLNLW